MNGKEDGIAEVRGDDNRHLAFIKASAVPGTVHRKHAAEVLVKHRLRFASRARQRGAVMVEYVVIVGVVSLGVATAIAGLGPTLLAEYQRSRALLAMPFP